MIERTTADRERFAQDMERHAKRLRDQRRLSIAKDIEQLIGRYSRHADYMAGIGKIDEANDYSDAATALRAVVDSIKDTSAGRAGLRQA